MTGPPVLAACTTSPGAAGLIGEVSYEVRWSDGSRFSNQRKVNEHQARLLVDGGVCDEVRSPTGRLRYLKMHRSPSVKRFASILAQGNLTTTQAGNLHEHIESKRKGL